MSRFVKSFGLPLALTIIGALLTVASVLALTVMRPDTQITAADAAGNEPFVMTHEGVLALQSPPVTITAEAPTGTEVSVALGKASDAKAWLEGSQYREVSGLQSWTELKTATVEPPASPAQTGPLAQSDMWSRVETGTGKVIIKLDEVDPNLALIAATDSKAPAPKLTISWTQEVSIAWALVMGGIGILLMLLGLTLWYQVRRRNYRQNRQEREIERQLQRRQEAEPQTLTTEVGGRTVTLPSRRAMREARARGEASVTVGGQSFDTGLIPVVEKVREVEEPQLREDPVAQPTVDPSLEMEEPPASHSSGGDEDVAAGAETTAVQETEPHRAAKDDPADETDQAAETDQDQRRAVDQDDSGAQNPTALTEGEENK